MNVPKTRMLMLGVCSALLAGCISTPQTKALITPIGVIGVHSFAPPREAPRSTEFEQRLAQHAVPNTAEEPRTASSDPEGRT